jgi:hypothetical protein
MKIVLTKQPLHEIHSQCAICFLPEDVHPLRGAAGIVDWMLNGRLTRFVQHQGILGKFKESVLIQPGRLLACDKLLVLGMGPYHECNPEKILELGGKVRDVLMGLKAHDVSLSFPMLSAEEPPDTFAEYLTKGFLAGEDDKELHEYFIAFNLALSCAFNQTDEILLGIQKVKVELKKHFNVIVME